VTSDAPRAEETGAGAERGMLALLLAGVIVSLVMFVLRPVPGGRHYEYALILTASLTVIWRLYISRPRTFFSPGVLAFVMAAGLVLGTVNLLVIRSDSEVVRTYRSVFEALDSGQNPYTAGTIYHEIEGQGTVYGNFNYPPLEIAPYYLAYRIAGTWNMTVLALTMILIQALAAVILFRMFRRLRPALLWPFVPMILLGEVKTTVALTVLVTASVLWAFKKNADAPLPIYRVLIAGLFGLGLMTKFLVLPLMAAYYWHRFDRKNLKSLIPIAVDTAIAAATAVLIAAPFGIGNVLKNTVLFNIVLKDRAALTTFYPNVLSGLLAWAGWGALFPFLAAFLLLLAVLAAPKFPPLTAMTISGFVFMILATTPEPQFLPPLLLITAVAQGMAAEAEARLGPPAAWERLMRPAKGRAA